MILHEIVQFFSVPWVQTLLSLLGLTSIPLAIWLYKISKRKSELSYQIREFSVVGGRTSEFTDELTIHFNGNKVNEVTSTEVVIWNSGNTTIDGKDIVGSDPLRIICEDGFLLKISALRSSRSVITPSFNVDDTTANICFEYLDEKDGFIIQIIHSGGKDNIRISGSVKGLPKGIKFLGESTENRSGKRFPTSPFSRFTMYMMIGAGISTIISATVPAVREFPLFSLREPSDDAEIKWIMFWMGVFYTILPVSVLWVSRRRYPITLAEPREAGRANFLASVISKLARHQS